MPPDRDAGRVFAQNQGRLPAIVGDIIKQPFLQHQRGFKIDRPEQVCLQDGCLAVIARRMVPTRTHGDSLPLPCGEANAPDFRADDSAKDQEAA